eukprot:2260697-Pyramimonas_sp.AAC.1
MEGRCPWDATASLRLNSYSASRVAGSEGTSKQMHLNSSNTKPVRMIDFMFLVITAKSRPSPNLFVECTPHRLTRIC